MLPRDQHPVEPLLRGRISLWTLLGIHPPEFLQLGIPNRDDVRDQSHPDLASKRLGLLECDRARIGNHHRWMLLILVDEYLESGHQNRSSCGGHGPSTSRSLSHSASVSARRRRSSSSSSSRFFSQAKNSSGVSKPISWEMQSPHIQSPVLEG